MNRDCVEVNLCLPASVRDLKQAILDQHQPLRNFVLFGRIAIDHDFVSDDAILSVPQNVPSMVALIPPVSGG